MTWCSRTRHALSPRPRGGSSTTRSGATSTSASCSGTSGSLRGPWLMMRACTLCFPCEGLPPVTLPIVVVSGHGLPRGHRSEIEKNAMPALGVPAPAAYPQQPVASTSTGGSRGSRSRRRGWGVRMGCAAAGGPSCRDAGPGDQQQQQPQPQLQQQQGHTSYGCREARLPPGACRGAQTPEVRASVPTHPSSPLQPVSRLPPAPAPLLTHPCAHNGSEWA